MRPGARGRRAVIVIGLVLAVAAVLAAPRVTAKMPDVEVYRTAAVRAWNGEPLYRAEDGHYQFKYLPAFAVLAMPLGLLSPAAVKLSWFLGSVGLLVACLAQARRVVASVSVSPWWLVAVCVVTLGKFYAHELVLGQVNLLLLAVVLTAVRALQRGHEAAGGALVALAVVVKPHALLLAPWLVARRRVTAVAGLAAGLALVWLLPALRYGITDALALHGAWAASVTASTPALLFNQDNVSMAGVAARLAGAGATASVLGAAGSVVLLAAAGTVVLWRARTEVPDALEASLLLILMPLLSPQGWDYVLLVATPAVMLLATHADRMPRPLRLSVTVAGLVMGLSLYDVLGRSGYRAFMLSGGITACACLLAAGLVSLRRAGHA